MNVSASFEKEGVKKIDPLKKTLTAQVGQIKSAEILEDLLIGCNTEAEVVKVKKPVGFVQS